MAFNFGSSSTAPSTGASSFSFGAANTQPPASSTGFGFGSSSTAAPSSLFGSTGSTTTGNSTGFNFGTSTTTPAASATGGPGSGFSFGSAVGSTAAATTAPSSGFSFGSTFGSSGTQSAASSNATTAPSTSFSFGSSLGGGAAGATSTSTNASPFSFGGLSNAQPAAGSTPTGGSLFGAGSASSQPFSFSSNTNPSSSMTGFGSAFGASPANNITGFGPSAMVQADSPLESLSSIKNSYTDLQQSRFKHMFYNIVDPNQKNLYTRPAHISERLWKQAELDNPDPDNCIPAAVVGFKQLQERIEAQQQYVEKFKKYVEDLKETVRSMEGTSRATDLKLDSCRVTHIELRHKLLQVMRKIDVYQCLRKPLHIEETQLRNALERTQMLLNQPTQFKARLHELVSLQRMQDERGFGDVERLSEEDLEALMNVLDTQREGLQQLTKILRKDLRDVEIMQKGLTQRLRT